jgi:hypothetical protein
MPLVPHRGLRSVGAMSGGTTPACAATIQGDGERAENDTDVRYVTITPWSVARGPWPLARRRSPGQGCQELTCRLTSSENVVSRT